MGILGQLFSTSAHDLVGIQSRIEAVERLLDLDSDDVARVVGILGKGGIGKTTLAAAVYDRIFHKFDASCFLADVGKVSGHPGLVQEQLLCETLDQKNLKIRDVHEGTLLIRTRLSRLRTLIVVDNVDGFEQLEALAIEANWFGEGTRVIITTRYEFLLERFGVDEFYAVDRLNDEEALRLFCRNAFKCDYPKKDYVDLINRELQCLQGHPLSIKLWGSYLLNQNVSQWESALDRMKRVPYSSIHHYFQASYDALKHSEKETFLDIACFFIGEKINYVEEILRYRGFYSETAIRTLIDRSFINIFDQRILMHDLVRELGLKIAKQSKSTMSTRLCSREKIINSIRPGLDALILYPENLPKDRLWNIWDFGQQKLDGISDVDETGIGIRCGRTDSHTSTSRRCGRTDSHTSTSRLVPHQSPGVTPARSTAHVVVLFASQILKTVQPKWNEILTTTESLRLLIFRQYPLTSLPSSFEPDALVQLIMPDSSVTLLWEGIKALPNLKNLDLRNSKDLLKTPNFTMVPNLERLDLEGCIGLLQLHSSIGILLKLKFLNLKNCIRLISVPNSLFGLSFLENLNLAGCSKFAECLNFDDWRSSMEVKVPSNQDAPLLEKCLETHQFHKKRCEHYKSTGIFNRSTAIGVLRHDSIVDPLNLDEERHLENQYINDGVHIHVDENVEDDYVAKSTERSTHKGKKTISMSEHKSKKDNTSNEMSETLQSWTVSSKARTEEFLARTERHKSKSIETTNSTTIEDDYSHVKCVEMLNSFEDTSDDVYVAALDKFNDEGWRKMFLTMPIERKKAWLTRLI